MLAEQVFGLFAFPIKDRFAEDSEASNVLFPGGTWWKPGNMSMIVFKMKSFDK